MICVQTITLGSMNWVILIGVILGATLFCGIVVLLAPLVNLWLFALKTGSLARIGLFELLWMRLHGIDVRLIARNKITAAEAGLNINISDLKHHYLAGGRVPDVVRALITAKRANVNLTLKTATAIDLAGRDILNAVQTCVHPKVLDCPNPIQGRNTIDAVAQDGIQLKVKARVTVRAKIERLLGGAAEETIIARVGEGIVTTIGSARTYKSVLENPDMISKAVLAKGLDAGTAFEILSIDIADVDVGDNIGAQLQAAQAEAEARRLRAEAERSYITIALRNQNQMVPTELVRRFWILPVAKLEIDVLVYATRKGIVTLDTNDWRGRLVNLHWFAWTKDAMNLEKGQPVAGAIPQHAMVEYLILDSEFLGGRIRIYVDGKDGGTLKLEVQSLDDDVAKHIRVLAFATEQKLESEVVVL